MRILFYLLFLSIPLFLGCGNKVQMSGKVSYSDDGSPLTYGLVLLETDSFMARGTIMSDGTFTVASTGKSDGLPVGKYKVAITGTQEEIGKDKKGLPIYKYLIDPKYADSATSGLTLEVTPKTKNFDFTVERFKPK